MHSPSLQCGWNPDIEAVTLLTLCEGSLCWGVRQGHLAGEDPPVDAWLMNPSGRVSGV